MDRSLSTRRPSALVGIVTRDRADILRKAIQAAVAQRGYPVRVEVIDDGSVDSTPALAGEFSSVGWIRRETPQGYMAARNHWMTTSPAEYFVSLDDDAWFLQNDEIAVAIALMERDPGVAVVAFDILSPDRPDVVPRTSPRPTSTFIGCGHVVRLSALRAVGAYESVPGSYGGEEKDLSLRFMNAGYQVVLVPGVHVWHDKTPVAREELSRHASTVCNDLTMSLRRTPAPLLPAVLALKVYQHLSFARPRGLLGACMRGFGQFLRFAPKAVRTRNPVRAATLRHFMRLSRS